jgi:RNA polymerase sigma-70 factor (ECF subfamily)
MEDRDLDTAVEAAGRGEEWAASLLYRAVQPLLLRYLGQKAPGHEQDLASETWLAAAQSLPRFEGDFARFRALLFTIARRRVVDHYRRQGRRPRAVVLEEEADFADLRPGPEDLVEQMSASEAVAALVGSLPEAQAEVILLRVLAGLSVEEAAQVMGRSAGSVRILQHRALRRLAKKFQGEGVTR